MGVVVKAMGSKIRVFKWDITPQQGAAEEEALGNLGGIFLFRLRTIFATQMEAGIDQDHEVFFPKTSLMNLSYFETARKLIGTALKQLPDLDSCQNLAILAGTLAADLLFKFYFGTKILSGKGPIPVIFLRLEVKLQPEKPNVSQNASIAARKFPGNIYQFIYDGCDMRVKQLRRLCRKLCCEDVEKPPLGFEEVKADFEVKYFEEALAGDDPEMHQCRICFEGFSDGAMVVETSCSYRFHKRCMYEWLLSSSSCPMCGSSCIVNV